MSRRTEALSAGSRVVFESTGGYERSLVLALGKAGLPAVLVNPWRVRRFGEGLGQLAKTDPIDARLLAHFGAVATPQPTPVQVGRSRLRTDLIARRRQLIAMIVAEKNRLSNAPAALRREIAALVRILERRVARIDERLDDLLDQDAERRAAGELLRTAPRVGPGVARTLLVDLPELAEPSAEERSRPSSASRPSQGTAAPGAASDTPAPDAPRPGPRSTWLP